MSKKDPKILFWDIETCPNLVLDFQCGYNKTITHGQVLEERKIVGVCYKYAKEKKVHKLQWSVKGEGLSAIRDDRPLLEKFSKVLLGCDVAIAHNGDNFDYRWVKGRVLYHRLPPLTGVSTIDTYKLSKSNFNINSHKLDYLSQFLFNKHKLSTDFNLWKDVWANNRSQLKYMMDYCATDTVLLEEAFWEMLPYCERLPVSLGLLNGSTRDDCPACGGFGHKHSKKVTRVGKYQKYQCQSCGHIWADTRMIKEEK